MSEYHLEIKQLVDYPRCRIYREFVQTLIADRSIRTNGGSGLFYYTVLSCYANFRTSYRRLGAINYMIFPGEWLLKMDELLAMLRVNSKKQVIAILSDLQDRHLITFNILGNGRLVKYKVIEWEKYNRVLEYNAPCQKDTGFFFLPVAIASEIIGTRRPSEMDILLDLWLNTVYSDERVEGSMLGPVVYMRNGSGNPLVSYDTLARRWNMSKATVGRYLGKLKKIGYISLTTFPGTKGSVIYLQKYLSTMFRISDVLLDKEEIAMALNIKVELDGSVSNGDISVSKSNVETIVRKVRKILVAQGFSCFECDDLRHKLLKLSDCKRKDILRNDLLSLGHTRYRLLFYCDNSDRIVAFDITVKNIYKR